MKSSNSYHPKVKKSLGQNFLSDPNYIAKIISAVDPLPDDQIIEIGPGRGALTENLVESGATVIGIELDRDLIQPLQVKFADRRNFQIIEQDALTVDFNELLKTQRSEISNLKSDISDFAQAKLVANLPYYISTAILQRLAEQREAFSSLVLMFQKEVVDRITARAGNSERGYLTVLAEAAFQVEKLFDVPANAFRPPPKILSSVVRLTPKEMASSDSSVFRELVSAGFAQKRKIILNNLKAKYPNASEKLERSGIDGRRRAESLTLDEWMVLLKAFVNGPAR